MATTHWGFVDDFRRRYPKVNLRPERMIIDEGSIYCSAGHNAALDLSLYLVSKYCSHEVAVQCAKTAVFDMERADQRPYVGFELRYTHGDSKILAVQQWIKANFAHKINSGQLARNFGLSKRSLERKFKQATGETLRHHLQRVRVEAAMRLLEVGDSSFDEITWRVGYEDASSFRKIFTRMAGLPPKAYQRKFSRARGIGITPDFVQPAANPGTTADPANTALKLPG
jgi:transcriptional regulator GlxA family with amidase domain